MNIAIILAGGIGERVGARIPKQFIEILGKPIIAYTIDKFEKNKNIDAIEIVCVKTYIPYLKSIVKDNSFSKVKWITNGGNTFQESVTNGVFYLKNKIKGDDIVIIHFGASPFVEDEIIDDCISVCKMKGNAISTIPFFYLSTFRDKEFPNEKAGEWVNRDSLACMNSPHAFKFDLIFNLYQQAIETGKIKDVEPHTTTLMHSMGYPIYFSKGSQTNIKITTPDDLALFEKYVLGSTIKKD